MNDQMRDKMTRDGRPADLRYVSFQVTTYEGLFRNSADERTLCWAPKERESQAGGRGFRLLNRRKRVRRAQPTRSGLDIDQTY
jgi:hypothetical protein